MEKSIRVNVLGRDYALRVRQENEKLTREIAARVDARMQAFQDAHPEQAKLTTAVIAALSLAEELYVLRQQHDEAHSATDAELDALTERLAEALAAGDGKETENP